MQRRTMTVKPPRDVHALRQSPIDRTIVIVQDARARVSADFSASVRRDGRLRTRPRDPRLIRRRVGNTSDDGFPATRTRCRSVRMYTTHGARPVCEWPTIPASRDRRDNRVYSCRDTPTHTRVFASCSNDDRIRFTHQDSDTRIGAWKYFFASVMGFEKVERKIQYILFSGNLMYELIESSRGLRNLITEMAACHERNTRNPKRFRKFAPTGVFADSVSRLELGLL